MKNALDLAEIEKAKLNFETSLIPWSELQRYFAGGMVLNVSTTLDLVSVAYEMSVDNKIMIEQWLADNLLGQVSDELATEWFDQKKELWAVVVRPWVLVQDKK